MADVFGFQGVRAVLNESPDRARTLYIQRGRRDARVNELIHLAKSNGIRFQSVESAWFHKRLEDVAHQGVLLDCHELSFKDESALFDTLPSYAPEPFILLLDEVTDPRNYGACLRTANAAGVHAVVVPKRNSAPLNAVALKTAQGGAEGLDLYAVTNLARVLNGLRDNGVWIIGADGDAQVNYTQVNATGALGVVMGNEGKGLRRLTKEKCDQLVQIPMLGQVESLNVSVATGVLLFEFLRQRIPANK